MLIKVWGQMGLVTQRRVVDMCVGGLWPPVLECNVVE